MKKLILLPVLAMQIMVYAQDSSGLKSITVSGYAEAYYSYDFNRPFNNTKPSFLNSYNRDNEVNVNLAYIKAAYSTDRVRANISLGAGTYINANYSAEPSVLKNLYEANAGIKISRTQELWVDAGVFASLIGFESARGKDCWTLSRSLVAENTPYYEAGAKLTYTSKNAKWLLNALLLNGWQYSKA